MHRAKIKHSSLLASVLASIALLTIATPLQSMPPLESLSTFVFPIFAPKKSSTFGTRKHPVHKTIRHHNGVDLAAPKGTPIRAIMSGTVVFAHDYEGYGNLITIRHSDELTSHYGHCDKIKVAVGQAIKAGQIIGTVGDTGLATGPHLHFEIRIDGKAYNPEMLIPEFGSPAAG